MCSCIVTVGRLAHESDINERCHIANERMCLSRYHVHLDHATHPGSRFWWSNIFCLHTCKCTSTCWLCIYVTQISDILLNTGKHTDLPKVVVSTQRE